MEPLTIAGALIGAFLNKVLNETLFVIMLVLLLSFTAYKSLSKATKMYKMETRQLKLQQQPDGTKTSELTKMVHDDDTGRRGRGHPSLVGTCRNTTRRRTIPEMEP